MEARSQHEMFLEFQAKQLPITWRQYWEQEWTRHLEVYKRLGWKIIPIRKRSKMPLQAADNYMSHAAHGPYLSVKDGLYWIQGDYNIGVAASPSGLVWADLDHGDLPKGLLGGLVMKTPRGYALPLRPDLEFTRINVTQLKEHGWDFREDVMYELVPLSVTCLNDSAKGLRHDAHSMDKQCVGGNPHQYRIREWIDLTKPILEFGAFMDECVQVAVA